MVVIVCLDESRGMSFHGRRQSRDRAVRERILRITEGKKLWMSPYSYKLYGDMEGAEVIADNSFLARAGKGEFCLAESEKLSPYMEKIEQLIVFWWNRKYPADVHLDLELSKWKKLEQQEYGGFSHERITEEIYGRNGDI